MHIHRFQHRTKPTLRRILSLIFVTIAFVLVADLLSIAHYKNRLASHGAALTYTVCHAIQKPIARVQVDVPEKYYCSNEGCYSDEVYDANVIGAYQDGNTCAGIAKNLQNGTEES